MSNSKTLEKHFKTIKNKYRESESEVVNNSILGKEMNNISNILNNSMSELVNISYKMGIASNIGFVLYLINNMNCDTKDIKKVLLEQIDNDDKIKDYVYDQMKTYKL